MAKKRGKKRPPRRPSQAARPAKAGASPAARPAKAGASPPPRPAKAGASPPPRPAKAATAASARKPTKAERIEAAQRQRRRRKLLRRAAVAGVLLLLVGGVAAVMISNRRAEQRTISRLEAGACRFDKESDDDEGQGRNHVSGSVDYRTDPPSGGNHSLTPSAPSVYREPPPDEQVVHSMEHGDIVLWHRPDAAPDVLEQLSRLADRYDGDVLVVPRASMPTPVAATAWHRRLLCPAFEQSAFDLFVRTYRDKGPEKVPEG